MERRSRSRSSPKNSSKHRSRSPHVTRPSAGSHKPKLCHEKGGFSKHHSKNFVKSERYADHHKSAALYDNHHREKSATDYDQGYRNSSPKHREYELPEPKISSASRTDQSLKQYFFGPEGTVVDFDELRKITVEIRRTLPRGVAPVPASIAKHKYDPTDVVIPRRPGEGSKPIFDREELHPKVVEERFIKMEGAQQTERYNDRRPSASAGYHETREDDDDLRARLMERRMDSGSPQHALRPEWEPDFIKMNYYEHDNRGHNPPGNHHGSGQGGRGFHNAGSFRGHRGRRGNKFYGNRSPPRWKHDMYDKVDDKPSSITKA